MSRKIRPSLEALEARDCPSVTIRVTDLGRTLRITGDAGWDSVSITQDDANNTLTVYSSPIAKPGEVVAFMVDSQTFKSSSIKNIIVDLGDGNDAFDYNLAYGTDLLYGKVLSVAGRGGDDVITVDTANMLVYISDPQVGGGTASTALSASDDLSQSPQQLPTDKVDEVIEPTGEDQIDDNVETYDPILPPDCPAPMATSTIRAKLQLRLEGGDGSDTVTVNLGHVTVRGGVDVRAALGDGDDYFWMNNYGTVQHRTKMSATVNGGLGNDLLYTNHCQDLLGTVSLSMNGGNGNDIVTTEHAANIVGTLSFKTFGGLGDDQIKLVAANAGTSTGKINVLAYGEAGDDLITCNIGSGTTDGPAAILYTSLLDGGRGNDEARIGRDMPMRNIETVTHLPS